MNGIYIYIIYNIILFYYWDGMWLPKWVLIVIFFLFTSDVEDLPFELRDVRIRTDKWVTDEFEILDFLGRWEIFWFLPCSLASLLPG